MSGVPRPAGFDQSRMIDYDLTQDELVRELRGLRRRVAELERAGDERDRLAAQLRHAQKMEVVGRIAGGLAHDFNNLLTVVSGYTALLLDRLPEGDPCRAPVREIQQAGERAADLIRQLLSFSRKSCLRPAALDLNAVLVDVAPLLRVLAGKRIAVVTEPEPGLGPVFADRGQLEHVILNLAVNARDAMPQGGRLLLQTDAVTLGEPSARAHPCVAPGRYARLTVADTGCGMDEATRARLFEPFFTTKETGKGTGLGLATAHSIVKQSGGHIDVESAPGRGSTFRVYLPLAAGGSDRAAPGRR